MGVEGTMVPLLSMLVTQSFPILCNSIDCSPPNSSIHGILQARILDWVAILFPGDLPDPGMEPTSPTLQADSLLPGPGKLCSKQAKRSQLNLSRGETGILISG